MSNQHDMFEHESIDASVLDNLQDFPVDTKSWPALILELRGVIAHELEKNKIESSALSLKLSLSIGQYLGGAQVYLPRGDALQRYIRDIEIWEAFTGNNVKQLARKHHLTEKSIYEIIARLRRIELQRRQPDLFV